MEEWREIQEQPVFPEEKTLRELFDSCIEPGAGARIRGEQFRLMAGPCVYMFFLVGEPLYIGASAYGISRPSGQHHMEVARDEADEVLIFPCQSTEKAFALESMLLSRLETRYNSRFGLSRSHENVAKIMGITVGRLYGILGSRRDFKRTIPQPKTKERDVLRWHDIYDGFLLPKVIR